MQCSPDCRTAQDWLMSAATTSVLAYLAITVSFLSRTLARGSSHSVSEEEMAERRKIKLKKTQKILIEQLLLWKNSDLKENGYTSKTELELLLNRID